jgi:hypothetical protein
LRGSCDGVRVHLQATDPSTGNVYYYNTVTNETSWEPPAGFGAPTAPASAAAAAAQEKPRPIKVSESWLSAAVGPPSRFAGRPSQVDGGQEEEAGDEARV